MARATATFSVTEATDFESGDLLRYDKFLAQVLQNLEFAAQLHDHSGDAGDGATLVDGNQKNIWYYGPATGS